MSIFLYPAMMTLTFYTVLEIFMKTGQTVKTYFLIFLCLVATSYLSANTFDDYYSNPGFMWMLKESDKAQIRRMIQGHRMAAQVDLQIATKKSLMIPDPFIQKFTNTTITAFIAALPGKDPKSKAVTALIVLLQAYLDGVYEEWKAINTYLRSAEYNFEMMEFYEELLKRG